VSIQNTNKNKTTEENNCDNGRERCDVRSIRIDKFDKAGTNSRHKTLPRRPGFHFRTALQPVDVFPNQWNSNRRDFEARLTNWVRDACHVSHFLILSADNDVY
jgi:hypothetical protein